MAQYKVPQDVEADDKLLGPFSFRQLVYLLAAGGLVALAVGLAQLFPLLAIIPLPPVLLFVALALPLKKDQPMEAYLAAIVSYYMKPRTRTWKAGQRDSTIKIIAPKKIPAPRTRDITEEEATHRLSFLADIVDTEGYAIKGIQPNTAVREELVEEAAGAVDIFEGQQFDNLQSAIVEDETVRHERMMQQMQQLQERHQQQRADLIGVTEGGGIRMAEPVRAETSREIREPRAEYESSPRTEPERPRVAPEVAPSVTASAHGINQNMGARPISATVVLPDEPPVEKPVENSRYNRGGNRVAGGARNQESIKNMPQNSAKPSIMELANNDVYSVATIEKEANRLKRKEEGEVFISLH